MANSTYKNAFSKTVTLVGATVLLTASTALTACSTSPTTEDPVSEATQENVTTDQLVNDFQDYIGQTVTVREEVEEIVDDAAFLLDEDQLFGGENLLVINASNEGITLVEGDDTDVQVTGEVREFILVELEREYGFGLDPDLYADYEQQPVIIAQSIALAPDPDDISERPEDYYYERIAVKGEVEESLSANVLTIDDDALFGGEDLLVLNPNAEMVYQPDEEVVMTGTLRPFVYAELEQDYDLTWYSASISSRKSRQNTKSGLYLLLMKCILPHCRREGNDCANIEFAHLSRLTTRKLESRPPIRWSAFEFLSIEIASSQHQLRQALQLRLSRICIEFPSIFVSFF